MHQPTTKAPLQNFVQHHHHNDNEHTYHLIAFRYVAAYKYIQKFWKQTIARDASLCYVIITLFYITLTLQIMLLLNFTYQDISIIFLSPQGMDYSAYARSQSEPALQYNTGSDWLSPYTEWSQQGFQMQCSKVWCFYDSVILKQCKSLMPDSKTHGHCALVS